MTEIELALMHYDGDNSKPYCDLVWAALREYKNTRKLLDYRKEVFEAIKEYTEEECHHKSYEGTFEITYCYPDYFTDEGTDSPNFYVIKLHMYVIGPNRHYEWSGATFDDAFKKCKTDVDGWIAEFRSNK